MSKIQDKDVHCTDKYVSATSCNIFPLAKQCKLSFPTSQSQASAPFDLIHCDNRGPYRTPTYNDCIFFLKIVDDYSRGLWTILLPSKLQVTKVSKYFFACIHT